MVGLDELAYFVDLQLFLGQGSLKVQKPGMTEWHNVLGKPDILKKNMFRNNVSFELFLV